MGDEEYKSIILEIIQQMKSGKSREELIKFLEQLIGIGSEEE